VKHLSILIKKIEQSLRKNPRSVPLLDTMLMILVIAYRIMKIIKSLGLEMSYSMRRSCTKISCRERNRKKKNHNTQCLMRSLKKKFQRYQENQNVQKHEQQVPQIHTSVVIISTRLSRPHERYSSSLYYLLLTHSGEP
jgi:hypothetical protein